MARRRVKKRTHVGASNGPANKQVSNAASKSPKSMVIRIGASEVGPSVTQLVKDVRLMMEPDTAARLKERRANKLRDYLTMSGPLGVTHLLLFSRSTSGNTNLRMALTPRGPTLHFKVEKYSLCKDVKKAMKRPKGSGKEYNSPPLLVMNNFMSKQDENSENPNKVPKHLESLTTTMFQSLFPPINPQNTPLNSIRRVMLLNREIPSSSSEDDGTYVINLRHYAITTRAIGLSRPLRRLKAAEKLLNSKPSDKGKKPIPNLGKMQDMADFMTGGPDGEGYITDNTSGSEIDTDAEVEVMETATRKVLSQKARQKAREAALEGEKTGSKSGGSNVEKRGVKLVELGPRMRLRMTKVEEGVCDGKVMWHEFVSKSKEEVKKMDVMWEKRRQEKELRKKIQRENVGKKKKAKSGTKEGEQEADDDEDEMEEWDSDLDEDVEMGEVEEGDEEQNEGAGDGARDWEDEEMAEAARKLFENCEDEED